MRWPVSRADVGEGQRVKGGDDPPPEPIGALVGGAAYGCHLQAVLPHLGSLVRVRRRDERRETCGVGGRIGGGGQRLVALVSADEAVGLVEPCREDGAGWNSDPDVRTVHLLVGG